jgi:hypothetical protein
MKNDGGTLGDEPVQVPAELKSGSGDDWSYYGLGHDFVPFEALSFSSPLLTPFTFFSLELHYSVSSPLSFSSSQFFSRVDLILKPSKRGHEPLIVRLLAGPTALNCLHCSNRFEIRNADHWNHNTQIDGLNPPPPFYKFHPFPFPRPEQHVCPFDAAGAATANQIG